MAACHSHVLFQSFRGLQDMARKQTSKQRASANAAKKSGNPNKGPKVDRELTGRGDGPVKRSNGADITIQEIAKSKSLVSPVSCSPKGLTNLGNTCFFNSVMQNLCRTPGLLYALQSCANETNILLENENLPILHCELPSLFKLTQSLLNFLITMGEDVENSTGNSRKPKSRTRTESPRSLFGEICSASPRFRGYQQQDSQELLQALLDGLKTEEIKRRKQAILTKLGLQRKKAKDIDNATHEKVKGYGKIATSIETAVDKIFGGKIVSSVLCDECGRITQVVEDFLDIPLPIAEGVPMPHHSNGSKKSGKSPPTKEGDQDSDKEETDISSQNSTHNQSKHLKKKQRKHARKKNHSNKVKSQNHQNGDSMEHMEKLDEDIDKEKDKGGSQNTTDLLIDQNGHSLEEEFENHITDKARDVQNYDGESLCLDNKHDLNKKTNRDWKVKERHSGEASFNGDQIDDLTSQLTKLKISRNPIGTDFSSQRAESQISSAQPEEQCCKEVHLMNGQKIKEIEKHASDLVSIALEYAMQRYSPDIKTRCEDQALNHNGHVTDHNNIVLLGGETALEQSGGMEKHDRHGNSGNSHDNCGQSDESGSVDTRKEGVSEGSTSPSSGNDEEEASEEGDPLKRNKNGNGVSLFDTPAKKTEVTFTSFCSKLPTTVSPRYDAQKQECSIESCLNKFTMAEMLTGNNKFGCEECTKRQANGAEKPKTVYCNASKQLLIKTPPLVLSLQLKRFQQSGRSLRKFSKRVDIPFELDLSPFCTDSDNKTAVNKDGKILYRIYGVVEHSGSLSRGHYTAYVNSRQESPSILRHLGKDVEKDDYLESDESQGVWYHISDTSVSKSTLEKALNSNAYLLFYERVF